MSTIDFLKELEAFKARQNLYFIGLIVLFTIATVMTLLLLFWPSDKGDEEK